MVYETTGGEGGCSSGTDSTSGREEQGDQPGCRTAAVSRCKPIEIEFRSMDQTVIDDRTTNSY